MYLKSGLDTCFSNGGNVVGMCPRVYGCDRRDLGAKDGVEVVSSGLMTFRNMCLLSI